MTDWIEDLRDWWANVSTSQQFREKVGKSGRVYTLDPGTAVVTVRESESHG